jgi:uncharacterized protein (TIGR02217 family)
MSNLVYPSIGNLTVPGSPVYPPDLPGITLKVVRAPVWNTAIQQALSGKESRIGYQQYLMLEWTLIYEFLRDAQTESEFRTLVSFFNQHNGKFDSFLFSDPWFNAVTAQEFAVADGTTTSYQVTALYTNSSGTYAGIGSPEIIQNFQGTPNIYVAGVLQTITTDYTLNGSGIVTFTSGHIPTSGAVLSWTGSFYYRVRFDDDTLEFEQLEDIVNVWQIEKLKLRQIKL